jgi:hypothetical protein
MKSRLLFDAGGCYAWSRLLRLDAMLSGDLMVVRSSLMFAVTVKLPTLTTVRRHMLMLSVVVVVERLFAFPDFPRVVEVAKPFHELVESEVAAILPVHVSLPLAVA